MAGHNQKRIVDKIANDSEIASDLQNKTGINIAKVTSVNGLKKELSRIGLTLHESPDCKNIQFVSTYVHKAFSHSGGNAEMLERLIDSDSHIRFK